MATATVKPKPKRRMLWSVLHGLWLTLLYIIYLNSNWIVPFEEEWVVKLTKFETMIFPAGRVNDDILFINTSGSMALAPVNENDTVAITNRAKLAAFFNFLANHNNGQRYLLCDIRFSEKSEEDSLLGTAVQRLKRSIFPSHLDEHSKPEASIIAVNSGIADYVTYEALFSKMMLSYGNDLHSLPLKMYEETSGKDYNYHWPVLWSGLSWMPNSLFPEFYVTMEEVNKHGLSLQNVLLMAELNDDAFYENMIKNKLIVMGDFDNDVQPTAIGRMPGTVILLNCFLTLDHHYGFLLMLGFLFLFICFTLISYYVFYFEHLGYKYTSGKYPRLVKKFFAHRHLLLLLLLISAVSLLGFGLRCTVFPIWIYFVLPEEAHKLFSQIKYLFK